jgi:hypothetical protein
MGGEKESDVALEVQTSRVFAGASIAALLENQSFQEWWTDGMEEEWPPEILRNLP